jgi:peptide subunit release factor 1 (eRF1)
MLKVVPLMLPPHLEELVIDQTVEGNIQNFNDVIKSSMTAFIAAEEAESLETLERLRFQVAKNGLVCTGKTDTMCALKEFRCDLLVISKTCDPQISEPLVRMAVQQGIEIETVEDSDFLSNYDGVAGFLRYKKYT